MHILGLSLLLMLMQGAVAGGGHKNEQLVEWKIILYWLKRTKLLDKKY